MKHIAILGSTGSIGHSTLSIIESYPDRFKLVSMAAGNNIEAAFQQALKWKPRVLSVAEESDAENLRARLRTSRALGNRSLQRIGGHRSRRHLS